MKLPRVVLLAFDPRGRAAFCAFAALFLFLHLPWALGRPLAAPDELRYAEMAREMLASGDWVVPHLAGMPYLEKPPFGIWLGALAQWLFGTSAWAVRAPALFSTFLTALLLARHLRAGPASARAAWSTASIFTSFALVHALGSANILDPLLGCALTGAVLAFVAGSRSAAPRLRRFRLLESGLWLGAAFLTKGFVALALFVAIVLPYGVLVREIRRALRAFPLVLLAALALALPWSLAIAQRMPEFWEHFLWVEHIQRFASHEAAQHAKPFWYYLPVLLGGALPWLPLLSRSHLRDPRAMSTPSDAVLAACWVLGPLAFLSLSSGKLAPYLLPCFPGLAIGIGSALQAPSRRLGPWARFLLALLASIALLVPATLISWPYLPLKAKLELPEPLVASQCLWLAGGLGSALLFWLARAPSRASRSARILRWCFFPLGFAAAFAFPHMQDGWRQPTAILERHVQWLREARHIFSDHRLAVPLCWVLETPHILIVGHPGELDTTRGRPRISASDLASRVGLTEEGESRLVCRASWFREHAADLPPCRERFEDEGIVFACFAPR
jgi:4-amino-4-deoxy-L-arabinose transferase